MSELICGQHFQLKWQSLSSVGDSDSKNKVTSKIIQQVKVLMNEPNDLIPIAGAHMVGENHLLYIIDVLAI